ELVVPGCQRRVVDVEHDRAVVQLRMRLEPALALGGDGLGLVRVVALEVQRVGPGRGRPGSGYRERRAVVVLGLLAPDVDVRHVVLGHRRDGLDRRSRRVCGRYDDERDGQDDGDREPRRMPQPADSSHVSPPGWCDLPLTLYAGNRTPVPAYGAQLPT